MKEKSKTELKKKAHKNEKKKGSIPGRRRKLSLGTIAKNSKAKGNGPSGKNTVRNCNRGGHFARK